MTIWMYPTTRALKAHAFPARNTPSYCREYYASDVSRLGHIITDIGRHQLCATCIKKLARQEEAHGTEE